ncbi:hypothetical protein B484DRAFT_157521 [Ochromonadaceae sp. CCMP2298]|nr:hypothetical protein B484DRAFT_157521 [Ochromonadaceae sp. CCMP2298]
MISAVLTRTRRTTTSRGWRTTTSRCWRTTTSRGWRTTTSRSWRTTTSRGGRRTTRWASRNRGPRRVPTGTARPARSPTPCSWLSASYAGPSVGRQKGYGAHRVGAWLGACAPSYQCYYVSIHHYYAFIITMLSFIITMLPFLT